MRKREKCLAGDKDKFLNGFRKYEKIRKAANSDKEVYS